MHMLGTVDSEIAVFYVILLCTLLPSVAVVLLSTKLVLKAFKRREFMEAQSLCELSCFSGKTKNNGCSPLHLCWELASDALLREQQTVPPNAWYKSILSETLAGIDKPRVHLDSPIKMGKWSNIEALWPLTSLLSRFLNPWDRLPYFLISVRGGP